MALQETPKSMTLSEIRQVSAPVREADLPAIDAGFENLQSFELIQRIAKVFATSDLVPTQYRGSMANCIIALNMAHRMKADPLCVMQNLYMVHGRPGWSAQFMIATLNTCGRFSALRYEFFGTPGEDSWGCRAWAIEKATKTRLDGADVTITMAKSEGWYNKTGSKWKTMPQQMLMYRSAAFFIRTHAPELSMGLNTVEELREIVDIEAEDTFTLNQLAQAGGHVVNNETGEIVVEAQADDHIQPSLLDEEVQA